MSPLMTRLLRPIRQMLSLFSLQGQAILGASMVVGVSGLDVDKNDVYWLWSALAGLLVASLVSRRFARLDRATIAILAPRRVTVGEPITFALTIENDSARAYHGVQISGPALPLEARWTGARPHLAVVAAGGFARADAEATFGRRGEHHLAPFRAHVRTPLGLVVGPAIESERRRVLVVPRLAPVRRIITREGQRYQPGGVALASKTGESMELLGVRPYRPGDAMRDLHAKSWAKTGVPVVREYQQEYFSRVGVVVDTDRAASEPARLEAAISLAAGVVAHLSRGEALIDLLVVGDQVHPLTLGRSLGFLEQALDLLACVEPGPVLSADRMLAELEPHLSRLQSVVLIVQTWDGERQRLAQTIRERGTSVKTLLVGTDGPQADPELVVVTPSAIASASPLLL